MSATQRWRIHLWRKVGVGIEQRLLDPLGDEAQELEEPDEVVEITPAYRRSSEQFEEPARRDDLKPPTRLVGLQIKIP